jgi:DNA polymerase-3 subunit chi
MTERVDFYVLKSASPEQRLLFACRLAEKAYLSDLKIAILQDNLGDAKALDELLWTFNERSFVPHELCLDENFDPVTPVHLALDAAKLPALDLLLNLTDRMPDGFDRFVRIAEIMDGDPERRRLGRERFKSYRDLKVTMESHQIGQNDETATGVHG